MAELENLKEIQNKKWGGARPNAGRPLHSKNPETIEREAVKKVFQDRVAKNADKLFNAQLDLAIGEKYLMVITTTGQGSKQKRETTVVTDIETIKQFLDSEEDPNFGEENEYYFMSTKPANNMALDSLLNRSFGKADEKLDITTDGDSLKGIANPELAVEFSEFLKRKSKDK